MKMTRINIGEIIRQKVAEKGLSKKQFAESVGVKRQNVEKTVFQKHSVDTDLLCTISEVLGCNFFNYYTDDTRCNKNNYNGELRATLTIEMGAEKQDKVMRFVFGENNIEISDK